MERQSRNRSETGRRSRSVLESVFDFRTAAQLSSRGRSKHAVAAGDKFPGTDIGVWFLFNESASTARKHLKTRPKREIKE